MFMRLSLKNTHENELYVKDPVISAEAERVEFLGCQSQVYTATEK